MIHFHGDWLYLLSLRVATKCIGYKPVMAFTIHDDLTNKWWHKWIYAKCLGVPDLVIATAYVYTIQLGNIVIIPFCACPVELEIISTQ